jgi:hypothetical protein
MDGKNVSRECDMNVNEFLRSRRDELRMFFQLRFGRGWHNKIYPKIGGWMTLGPSRLARAEELARLHGFIPRDEHPLAQALERGFLQRLRTIAECLNKVPPPVGHHVTLGFILEEFFAYRPHRSKHKQKHKDAYSDVISEEFLVIEGAEQRTKYPTSGADVERWKTFEEWLTIPLTLPDEPPPASDPRGGGDRGPSSLSEASALFGQPRTEN